MAAAAVPPPRRRDTTTPWRVPAPDERRSRRLDRDDGHRCPAGALAYPDNALALAGPVLRQPQIAAVFLMVGRLAIAAEVGRVGLALGSLTTQEMPCLLGLQAFPKLVQQHEGDLVVAPDFAGQLKSRQTLDRIDEQEDREQQIAETHLAVGQDRSGGDAELV